MERRKRRPVRKLIPVNQKCFFCESKTTPDYKGVAVLNNFLGNRGGLVSRKRTGICARHQRALTVAVKRARHLSLLPFVVKVGA